MSSEMRYSDDDLRVIVQDWSESDPDQAVAINLARECLRLRALLARTEAGADVAVAHIHDYGDRVRVVWDKPWADFPVGTQFFTHPQDASGDAEDTKRMDWLVANVTETLTAKSIRGEFPYPEHKTQYVLPRLIAWADFHGQVGFREAIDIAMQAKEGK